MWFDLPTVFPADTELVWVRRLSWPAPPYQATFDLASFTFTDVGSGAAAPWWSISRWRPV